MDARYFSFLISLGVSFSPLSLTNTLDETTLKELGSGDGAITRYVSTISPNSGNISEEEGHIPVR